MAGTRWEELGILPWDLKVVMLGEGLVLNHRVFWGEGNDIQGEGKKKRMLRKGF